MSLSSCRCMDVFGKQIFWGGEGGADFVACYIQEYGVKLLSSCDCQYGKLETLSVKLKVWLGQVVVMGVYLLNTDTQSPWKSILDGSSLGLLPKVSGQCVQHPSGIDLSIPIWENGNIIANILPTFISRQYLLRNIQLLFFSQEIGGV